MPNAKARPDRAARPCRPARSRSLRFATGSVVEVDHAGLAYDLDMHVEQLWRYPVKSMQGERLVTAEVGELGIIGDRQWAVVDLTSGTTLTARREPQLLWASAAIVPGSTADDVGVEITLPDGSRTSEAAALSDWLGRPVELQRAGGGSGIFEIAPDFEHEDEGTWLRWDGPLDTFHDAARTRVSIGALDELREWDPRRFRFNVIVAGGLARPLAGTSVQIGTTTLDVIDHIDRCVMTTRPQPGGIERDLGVLKTIIRDLDNQLGVAASVSAQGTISVGDAVSPG